MRIKRIRITVNPIMFLFWVGVTVFGIATLDAPFWAVIVTVAIVSFVADQVVKFINRI
jgi:hypothetical protein